MEMPTPCIHCNTVFELNDGYGSKKWHPNITICEDCYGKEYTEIVKDEEIEHLKELISESEWEIKDAKTLIADLETRIKESADRLKELEITDY